MNIKHIENKLNEFVKTINNDGFYNKKGNTIIESVSIGVQLANHPYFDKLRTIIDEHLSPIEFYNNEYPDNLREDLSVVTIALHYGKSMVIDNAKEEKYPSYSWYEMTDKFFNNIFEPIKEKIQKLLEKNKIIFPTKMKLYNIGGSEKIRIANWSERHIAFGCGLGSFGLNGAIITDKGCTLRLISFITDAKFIEYNKPLEDVYANCLYFQRKECGKCIKKCPVDSITGEKRIIENCYDKEFVENKEKAIEIYGKEITACGLCMSGVPCSFTNPMEKHL